MENEILKQRILEYRIKNDIKQKDMAKVLGIGYTTLVSFMTNKGTVQDITKAKIKLKLDELEGK